MLLLKISIKMKYLLIFPRDILSLGKIRKRMRFYVISPRPHNVTIENIDEPVIFQDIFYVFQNSFEILIYHRAKKMYISSLCTLQCTFIGMEINFSFNTFIAPFQISVAFFLTFASDNDLNLKRIRWVIIVKQVNKCHRQFERLTANS